MAGFKCENFLSLLLWWGFAFKSTPFGRQKKSEPLLKVSFQEVLSGEWEFGGKIPSFRPFQKELRTSGEAFSKSFNAGGKIVCDFENTCFYEWVSLVYLLNTVARGKQKSWGDRA
ncbi:hypothetical protein [Thermococcus sp.]